MPVAIHNRSGYYLLSLLFVAVLLTGMVYGFTWTFFIPAVLGAAMLAFVPIDKLTLAAVFVTPLSINLQETGLGLGISIPAEPMIFGIMLLFFIKLITDGRLNASIMKHPVSILIYLHIGWMLVSTFTSSMPLVSLKATLARVWFVTVFYFLAAHMFHNFITIKKFIWMYTIPLIGVIVYSMSVFIGHGSTEEIAHVSMVPFYNDHTAYGAMIALFIPPIIALCLERSSRRSTRISAMVVLAVLITAIVFSYTRAAWVSLAATAVCALIFAFRVHTAIVVSAAVLVISVVVYSWTDIIIKLESNTERSSTDYREHLQSISNISTDASNVERVNRWLCALRMFNERKVFGFGPGTYQFKYGIFQHNDEKTYISTNFGDVGSAHSEYLGPLSEQGLPGLLLFAALCIAISYYASRFIIHAQNSPEKTVAMGILLGLVTYFVHGFLNYFLDTDKASVPFWGFAAALTALQVFHDKDSEKASSL